MMLTVIGGLIFIFAITSFLLFPYRLMQGIVFFSSFSATAVINFSNYGMSPAAVLLPFYLIWRTTSGDAFRRVCLSRDQLVTNLFIVSFMTMSIFSLLINAGLRSVLSFQVTQTAYVVFGTVVTLVLSTDFVRRDRLEMAVRAMRFAAVFIALWGLLQAICFSIGFPYPELFNNSNSHFADMFNQHIGGILRIASVTNEPSFLAVSLLLFGSFGSTLLVADAGLRTSAWIFPVSLALLVVTASTSTTGYVGLFVLMLLLVARRPSMILIMLVAAVVVTFILMFIPSLREVIYSVTLGKTATGSYLDRSGSVWNALPFVAMRPLVGWGWGGIETYSIVTQLLTSVGIIGTAFFMGGLVTTIVASRLARRSTDVASEWPLIAYAEGAENALIVYMAQSVVAGFHFVVADFWCFWALAIAIPSCMRVSRYARVPRETALVETIAIS
jgi:hypothetical protein